MHPATVLTCCFYSKENFVHYHMKATWCHIGSIRAGTRSRKKSSKVCYCAIMFLQSFVITTVFRHVSFLGWVSAVYGRSSSFTCLVFCHATMPANNTLLLSSTARCLLSVTGREHTVAWQWWSREVVLLFLVGRRLPCSICLSNYNIVRVCPSRCTPVCVSVCMPACLPAWLPACLPSFSFYFEGLSYSASSLCVWLASNRSAWVWAQSVQHILFSVQWVSCSKSERVAGVALEAAAYHCCTAPAFGGVRVCSPLSVSTPLW